MRKKAYGKISLYLQVLDRKNGNLQFRNILFPLDLFDMVYLEKSEVLEIETDKHFLPNDRRNTVFRAVELMKEKYKIKDNFKIKIVKNIPAQSGLGGGSADAAAVICMINEVYQLNLSDDDLIDVASEIDEDTPFCLFNKPAIVSEAGSGIEFINTEMEMYYVLIKPKYGTSTKRFMKKFNHFNDDDYKFNECLSAIESNDFEGLIKNTHNDFQKTVEMKNKSLNKAIRQLNDLGLKGVCMSGSGTGVYGLTQDVELARKIHKKLAFKYPFVKYGKI